MVFGAREDQLEIGLGGYRFWQCLPEAGPAGATVVFHLAVEQGLRAGGADERSVALFAVERASPGRLGVFFEHDAIGGRWQQGRPFRFRFDEFHTAALLGGRHLHGGSG